MRRTGAKKILLLLLAVLCLVLSACGVKTDFPRPEGMELIVATPTPAPTPAPTPPPTPVPTPDPMTVKIDGIMSEMTLEEKVGQLFFTRCPWNGAEEMEKYRFGGYILFGRDFDGLTADTVKENIQSYKDASKIPPFIGVDEEGGSVVRVSSNPNLSDEPFWSPRALYDSGGMELAMFAEKNKAELLSDLGINVNFAPVCDISTDYWDFMYDRSLGQNPNTTGEFAEKTVKLYSEYHMGNVLKHFPGYGNNSDTHTGSAYDERPIENFRSVDFIPFEYGIDAGAGCVLMSHNVVVCVDSELPASLSKPWHDLLRDELGFEGCIITDDLAMDAVWNYSGAESAAVLAVQAGNDLLCCTDYEVRYPAVLEAVQSGEITEKRIDESVRRILKWKYELGLLK